MKSTLFVFIILTLSSLLFSQAIIWEEPFEVDDGLWTLDQNWLISVGTLTLNWSPAIAPFDLSAVSPLITLPDEVNDLIVSLYFQEYSSIDEMAEISVIYGEVEDILWSWDLTQGSWGESGGQDLSIGISAYGGEEVQFRFRSYGASTFNFDYWIIYNLAISASLDHDLSASNIDGPASCIVDQEEIWSIKVENAGLSIEDNFTVKLMKEGDIELGSVIVSTPLLIGNEVEYEFSWSPSNTEFTYLYGEVELAGDEFTGNNITSNLSVHVMNPDNGFALSFDGFDDDVVIQGDPAFSSPTSITVEAWVLLNELTDLPSIIGNDDWSNGEAGFILRIEDYIASNTPQFQIGSNFTWQADPLIH